MNVRYRWIVGGVALLLVLTGIGASIILGTGGQAEDSTRPGTSADGENASTTPGADASGESDSLTTSDGESDADGPGVTGATQRASISQTASRRLATSVKDTPTPPPAITPPSPVNPGDPADPDDGLTEEELRYLEETRAIVEADPARLQAAAAAIIAALDAGDEDALADMLAEDEGSQPEFLGYITERYPTIVTTTAGSTINVFASGDATIYIAYALVVWEDAGIKSEHTIPIPMRFVDGAWRFTSVEHWSDSLSFVQAVGL